MVMEFLQLYLTNQNLLIAKDLWHFYDQILLIISLKEFTKLIAKIWIVFLNMKVSRIILIKYKFLSYNKDLSNKTDEELKERFKNTFKFSNNDINKFIFLLRKIVYHYEYMDGLEKFNEALLPEKEEFDSNLNMQNITGPYYMHKKNSF